jgi:hypothetical protein
MKKIVFIVVSFLIGVNLHLASATFQSESSWTLVHLSDLHMFRASGGQSPQTVTNMVNWIVQNKDALNIKAVVITGDTVQRGSCTQSQYTIAHTALSGLDGQVSWFITPGNHEMDPSYPACISLYDSTFGDRNNYGLLTIGNEKIGIMNLEYFPSSSVINWANQTIYNNSNYKWIVTTHDYMTSTENPDPDCSSCYRSAAGNSIFNGLNGNNNLFMALSGHYAPPHELHKTVIGDGGQNIFQIMTDYQDDYQDKGRLRYYVFNNSDNKIYAYTYEVSTGQYIIGSDSQFVLDNIRLMNKSTIIMKGPISETEIRNPRDNPWAVISVNKTFI